MRRNKSIKVNAVYNIIKTLCSIVFPLITFPYATRMLGSQNYGKYSFSASIVSYVALIAAFGISNYATREGARRRKSLSDLQTLVNQIFTLNVCTTAISYIVLFILMLVWHKLHNYSSIVLVIGISVLFTTLGTDWVNTIFEDYAYITKRYIICYIIQMSCLFFFVKSEADVLAYAFVSIISNVLANISNMVYIRRKLHINPKLIFDEDVLLHLKPTMIFFVSSIVSTIYLNSDITILGILKDDHVVGIYTVSSRIYVLVRHLINAITAVIIPRISTLLGEKEHDAASNLISKAFGTVVIVSFPAIVGMIFFRGQIISLMSGKEYIEAIQPLCILSMALVFATLANIFVNAVLVPYKKEKQMLLASTISATVNIVLNVILIPTYSYNAAAFTTLLAEAIVVSIGYLVTRKLIKIHIFREFLLAGIGSMIVLLVGCIVTRTFNSDLLQLAVSIVVSGIIYMLILVIAKGNSVYDVIQSIYMRIKKRF